MGDEEAEKCAEGVGEETATDSKRKKAQGEPSRANTKRGEIPG
jgi:hypothetical protein